MSGTEMDSIQEMKKMEEDFVYDVQIKSIRGKIIQLWLVLDNDNHSKIKNNLSLFICIYCVTDNCANWKLALSNTKIKLQCIIALAKRYFFDNTIKLQLFYMMLIL